MAKIRLFLFYLLLFFLPAQLGRHFFFDFSFISGIRSDYLAPTIYLTDIIIFILLIFSLRLLKLKFTMSLLFVIYYLLFNSLLIASNQWIALYKSAKILELILLGLIINKIKPDILTILKILSLGVFYSSVMALWQFILQHSIGGLFWFLGERTFYATTPGIALFSWFGKLFLRPYATFSHPNVLGGFLAITLPLFLYAVLGLKRKVSKIWLLWFKTMILVGNLVLFISFSRSAWVVCLLGYAFVLLVNNKKKISWLNNHKSFLLTLIYSLMIFSIILPLFISRFSFGQNQSLSERTNLVKTALTMLAQKPIFGWGLNNFIVQAKNYSFGLSDLYIFQPVHNLYLLVVTETGLTGFLFFTVLLTTTFFKSMQKNFIVTVSLTAIILLGCFDHYFFTLQQAQLFLTVIISIAFLPQNT
ncbi:O-antigen ligase family protein [Candidatus Microgenomates bacterium]|nr:O-antigen ligase family protein [Candidatus Microgenomates bacterium]